MITALLLTRFLYAEIVAHIAASPELEVCGLVGGQWQPYPRRAWGRAVFAVPNVADKPRVRYQMAAAEQVRVMLDFERQGWQTVAIYHSHPQGDARPSPDDVAAALYPDALYLIGVPGGELRAWRIVGGRVTAAEIQVLADDRRDL